MFSFHRPKVYRSSTGCCICKAKSSSSRFTDSKKYEQDFLECFQLSSRRQGEICNACVLLVKRWKKLPIGSDRNWRHVVDARAGPGMKSMSRFKSKVKKLIESTSSSTKKLLQQQQLGNINDSNHTGITNSSKGNEIGMKESDEFERESSPTLSDKSDEDIISDGALLQDLNGGDFLTSTGSSRAESPFISDTEDHQQMPPSSIQQQRFQRTMKTKSLNRRFRRNAIHVNKHGRIAGTSNMNNPDDYEEYDQEQRRQRNDISEFIDMDYWKRIKICCGHIYRGPNQDLIIDTRLVHFCDNLQGTCTFRTYLREDRSLTMRTLVNSASNSIISNTTSSRNELINQTNQQISSYKSSKTLINKLKKHDPVVTTPIELAASTESVVVGDINTKLLGKTNDNTISSSDSSSDSGYDDSSNPEGGASSTLTSSTNDGGLNVFVDIVAQ